MSNERYREISVGVLRKRELIRDGEPGSFQGRRDHSELFRFKLVEGSSRERSKGKHSPKAVSGLSRNLRRALGWGSQGGLLGRGGSEGKKESPYKERGDKGQGWCQQRHGEGR